MNTLSCEQIKLLLEAYLDNESRERDPDVSGLSSEQRETVTQHLSTCSKCRDEFAELNQLEILMQSVNAPQPKDEFWTRYPGKVWDKIAQSTEKTRQIKIRLMRVAGAIGLAATILIAILIYPLLRPTTPLSPDIKPTLTPKVSAIKHKPSLSTQVNSLIQLYATIQDESNRKDIESEIVDTLGSKTSPYLRQTLEKSLRDKNYEQCSGLIKFLGRLKDVYSIPILVKALDEESLRTPTVASLVNIGTLQTLPALVKCYSDKSVQPLIAQCVKQMGKNGENALQNLLYSNQIEVKRNVITLIGYLQVKSAIPSLTRLASDKELKSTVIDALGNIGSPESIPVLIALAQDQSVTQEINNTIAKMGKSAIPYLVKYFESPNKEYKQRAFEMLTSINDTQTVPYLIASLSEIKMQSKAEESLKNLTDQDFGKDPNKWWQWWYKESRTKKPQKSGGIELDIFA